MTPSETKKISAYTSGQLVQVQDVSEPLGSQGKHIDLGAIISNLKNGTIVHPSYVAPTVQLSSTQSQSGLEIGQTVNIPLVASFTQNDGGTATGTIIKKDGTQIAAGNSFTDSAVVMSATPKVYQSVVAYGGGAVKNNNFGDADSSGQITAGNATSLTNLSYRGYYKVFFGNSASAPTNSATVRALSSQEETSNTVMVHTGTTNRNFPVSFPAGRSIISAIDTSTNVNITDQFTISNINVNDAAASAVNYKLALMTTAIPYPADTTLLITLSPY